MTQSTIRTILRWMHLLFSIPILGYIYSPFDKIPDYAPLTRFFFVPVMVLSGLWMWKGHVVRRLIFEKSAYPPVAPEGLLKGKGHYVRHVKLRKSSNID